MIKRFSFTVNHHLDRYGNPTERKTIHWMVQYEDGTVESNDEIVISPNGD